MYFCIPFFFKNLFFKKTALLYPIFEYTLSWIVHILLKDKNELYGGISIRISEKSLWLIQQLTETIFWNTWFEQWFSHDDKFEFNVIDIHVNEDYGEELWLFKQHAMFECVW